MYIYASYLTYYLGYYSKPWEETCVTFQGVYGCFFFAIAKAVHLKLPQEGFIDE